MRARRPVPRRVDGEQPDHVVVHAQGERDGGLDPGLRDRIRRRCELRIGRGVLDDEDAAPAEPAEGEVGEPFRHPHVRAGEAAAGRRREPALLAEVDGEPLGAEQLGHPLDGRLQRVGERELRDRLPDDREERARPLQLLRQRARPLAGPEGVRRPDAEGREARELVLRRRLAGGKEELQSAHRRLAEEDRRRGSRPEARLHCYRPRILERARGRIAGAGDHRLGLAHAEGADEDRPHVLRAVRPPEERGSGSHRLGGEPRHLLGRPQLVGAGREGLARELERAVSLRRLVPLVPEGAHGEPHLVREQARQHALVGGEAPARAHQLEARDRPAVERDRDLEDGSQARPLGRAPNRSRQPGEIVVLGGRQLLGGEAGALELRRDRG